MYIDDIEELKGLEFNHKVKIQKRFNDVDMLGHVNNAVQLTYFDYGKIEYMNAVKFKFPEENGDFLVNVNINVDFKEQVFFDDELEVWTKIHKIGHKSVRMIQVLVDSKTGHVKTIGRTVMCGFNLKEQKSILIRDDWREMANRFEQYKP
ncbi:MAG: acyl-CoA thioesterase [Paludibacteraceae bacterium]|nr:acyl-CoA thioesterase [Paludibacteraceae bacterium]MBR6103877.1 acyl-CoA thioesterase [Paludibacteraceae bacterium]